MLSLFYTDVRVKKLLEFNQKEFFTGIDGPISMDDTGYIYVPTKCEKKTDKCFVHFYFHGCLTARYVELIISFIDYLNYICIYVSL
jgi:hypothetical protein